jgi:hypothetical protein
MPKWVQMGYCWVIGFNPLGFGLGWVVEGGTQNPMGFGFWVGGSDPKWVLPKSTCEAV